VTGPARGGEEHAFEDRRAGTRGGPRALLLARTQSYRAGAFVAAARALGVDLVVGSDRAQALAPLHPQGHLVLDFADVPGAVAAIEAAARTRPIDAVLAADDDGVELGAAAARALGVAHHAPDAVGTARDKGRLRTRLRDAGRPGPWFRLVPVAADAAEVARDAPYPCVVKPTRLSASRGVIRADDPAAFVAAFARCAALVRATGGAEVLVESYLDGAEVAVEGLVDPHGALRVLAVFDKPDPLEGPWFEETLYVTPSRLAAADRAAVEAEAAAVVRALGLGPGPVHAELRVREGAARLLEIAPRSIGGLCSRALRFHGDASLEVVILRQALGELEPPPRESRAAGVAMIPIRRGGRLAGVRGRDAALAVPGVDEVRITIPVGDVVIPLPEGARYLGFVFARADDPAAVEAALHTALERIEPELVPEGAE
jgi:biotin carboxylase